ncbi:MAG TPA: hypothetical protein VFX96_00995, partial [Pyrinomonadaceae bacterium]|nr:hypothetical protein [Pyrinomonadaceae bacterium]
EMSGRFDELKQGVEDKKNDLASGLAQKYKEARDKADEALKTMQEEDKGLVTALVEKLGEVVEILRNFKNRIMGMLKKAADTIDLIVADPIGFLKNLLNAVKKGIQQFATNIWEHLKAGFMGWLFGSLSSMGITLPKDFSLPSILKLVLDVLGITWPKIRAKVVKIIGERNMALLEAAVELVKALIDGGPAALWEKIKEYLGNLKEMIIDAIQEWVVTSIIKSAITKLATMFNPVGAIIQAIITIYNTVMFFIERINQILDFVEAVINSVHQIATGAIDSAANWIEKAMARTIPLIISFLARLLGLGGITEKIKSFITKVQTKVDQAIDKVIDKIVGGIKKLFAAGKAVAGKVAKKIFQWWKAKKSFKQGTQSHSLFFTGEGPPAKVTVKSIQRPLEEYVRVVRAKIMSDPAHEANRAAYLATLGPEGASGDGDEKTVTGIQQKIYKLKTRQRSSGETEDVYATWTEELGKKINGLLDLLGGKLATLPDPDYEGAVKAVRPASVITYQGLNTTPKVGLMTRASLDGKGVVAKLSSKPGSEAGSMASHESGLYESLNKQRGIEIAPGHILNHHLYGSGSKPENIAPITKSVNNSMAAGIEKTLQKMVLSDNKAVHYVVKVVWPGSTEGRGGTNSLPEDKQLPERVEATLEELRFDTNKFKSLTGPALDAEMGKWENWTIKVAVSGSPAEYPLVVPNTALGLTRLEKLKAKRLGEDKDMLWSDFYQKHSLKRITPEERAILKALIPKPAK